MFCRRPSKYNKTITTEDLNNLEIKKYIRVFRESNRSIVNVLNVNLIHSTNDLFFLSLRIITNFTYNPG